MATSTYGTPYVQGSDLVSAYPTVSSSLATRVDEVSYKGNGLNAQTGTTYTLVAGDAGKTITLSNASPVAVTLPQDSTADLPDGAVVTFYNLGAGTVTISQGTGATLQGGSITLAQYAVTSVIKLSANTYGRFDGGPLSGLNPATPTSIANSGGTATLSGNTVTFTTVSSVSLNSCFTSTYRMYRIVYQGLSPSLNNYVAFRLRVSGSDNSTANYRYAVAQLNWAGTLAPQTNGTGQTFARLALLSAANTTTAITLDVANPQVADYTVLTGTNTNEGQGAFTGVYFNGTTQFDGFTLYSEAASTLTGTVSVYGYSG